MTNTMIQGRPYEPQVRTLMKDFGDRPRGTELTHEEIAAAVGEKPRSHRYRCLVQSWRRRLLKEKCIALLSVREVGYRFALPDEQVRHGAGRVGAGIKQMRRGFTCVDYTPAAELSTPMREAQLHIITTGRELLRSAAGKHKEMNIKIGATKALPNGKE